MNQRQPMKPLRGVKGAKVTIIEEEKSSLMDSTVLDSIPQSQDLDDPLDEDFEL